MLETAIFATMSEPETLTINTNLNLVHQTLTNKRQIKQNPQNVSPQTSQITEFRTALPLNTIKHKKGEIRNCNYERTIKQESDIIVK